MKSFITSTVIVISATLLFSVLACAKTPAKAAAPVAPVVEKLSQVSLLEIRALNAEITLNNERSNAALTKLNGPLIERRLSILKSVNLNPGDSFNSADGVITRKPVPAKSAAPVATKAVVAPKAATPSVKAPDIRPAPVKVTPVKPVVVPTTAPVKTSATSPVSVAPDAKK